MGGGGGGGGVRGGVNADAYILQQSSQNPLKKPCFVASAVYSGPGVKLGFSGRDSD